MLDGLANEMTALGLTRLHNYLIANCTIHALQLQLRNAIVAALGAGSLEKVNAMQLLHTVYGLQESLDMSEWRHTLTKSSQCVIEHGTAAAEAVALPDGASKRQLTLASNKAEFQTDFSMMHSWHTGFKKDALDVDAKITGTMLAKMQKPILTRWWTVGVSAACIFDCYLQMFYAAQIVINVYGSDSSPHKIATALFSMMKDPENFIDVTLIRCFNKAHTHPHLDWLQSCDNLSGKLGFSAHHISVHCYLMKNDLKNVLSLSTMQEHNTAVENCGVLEEGERHHHLTKLNVFMKEANESLDKHFGRWIGKDLLPAGMSGEHPIGKTIAAATLRRDLPRFDTNAGVVDDLRMSGHLHIKSTVHKRKVDLKALHTFVPDRQAKDSDYTQDAKIAAELIVDDDVDLRTFNYEGDNGPICLNLHSTCLPLASQTQFVESHVKDAKLVAQTDRSEQLRTCMAIVCSASPLGREKDGESSYNSFKMKALIKSAWQRSVPHMEWKRNQVN